VVAAVRTETAAPDAHEARIVGDLADPSPLDHCLVGVDSVVHLAARVHVMDDRSTDPDTAYGSVNVTATRRLAEAALRHDIKRFVFLSSVKVNGEQTTLSPFTEDDQPDPDDAYGRSKLAAERLLMDLACREGLEPVILRVPLVYGPSVKANFLSLLKLCDTPMPLPLGAISSNRRSLIYVENLADAIATAVTHPDAAREIFLVSDGEPVSTAALAGAIRMALGRPRRLLPVPPPCLRFAVPSGKIRRGGSPDRLAGN
jgi:nucleoside-diphosphate-sugar epimerase